MEENKQPVTKSRPPQARSYIGTLNNPKTEPRIYLEEAYSSGKFTYVGGQLEQGEEGTPHIQFFVHCKNPMRVTQLTKVLPGFPHLEKCVVQDRA